MPVPFHMLERLTEIQGWLKDVCYQTEKEYAFGIYTEENCHILQVLFWIKNARTDKDKAHTGRKWRLSKHMTKSEVIQTALAAMLVYMEHEVRENFLYKGKPIFGPHFNVDKLAELCNTGDSLDVRS